MTEDRDGESESRDRDDVLADLRAVREMARYKTLGDGRIRDEGRADIRLKYLRVLVQAANAERRLLKDRDLEALEDRIAALEGEGDSWGVDDPADALTGASVPSEEDGAVAGDSA